MVFDDIKEQFKEVVSHSQGIPNPILDDLFDKWLDNKRDFIEAFGGRLIYEYPEKVSFELGPREKKMRINDFVSLVNDRYDNSVLGQFILNNKEGFFNNVVVEDTEWMGEKIPKGMKLLRAFKYFESDPKALENIQNAASMIIQEDKIEGTLCLSVHPLDFLSVSENNHNWRSCHALDGEYRAGNLSYMVDKTTIICYLKSAKEEVLPHFPSIVPWNNKKWRVLFYFSDSWDMIFAGRQYPFSTETGIDFVKNKLFPMAKLGEFSDWTDKKLEGWQDPAAGITFNFNSPMVPIGEKMITLRELVVNEPGSLHFNDVLSSSCYEPVYAFRQIYRDWSTTPLFSISAKKSPIFKVGGVCNCLRCGKTPIQITESFMCNDCELDYGDSDDDMFAYCASCGQRFFYDDGVYVEGTDDILCPGCADTETDSCECCGFRFYESDLIYDRDSERVVCQECWDNLPEEE